MTPKSLQSKLLLKIMWTPDLKSAVWRMKSEENLSKDSSYVMGFLKIFDLVKWSEYYETKYKKWLDEDSDEIFDLRSSESRGLLSAINEINSQSNAVRYFYWFDVDRTKSDLNFVWKSSPISGGRIVDLGVEYHDNNRLVSVDDNLVFPL